MADTTQETVPLLNNAASCERLDSSLKEAEFTDSTELKYIGTRGPKGNNGLSSVYGAIPPTYDIKQGENWIRYRKDDRLEDIEKEDLGLLEEDDKKKKVKQVLNHIKVAVLFVGVFVATALFAISPDETYFTHQASVSKYQPFKVNLSSVMVSHKFPVVKLIMTGSFSLVVPSMNTNNITFRVTNPATGDNRTAIQVVGSLEEVTSNEEFIRTDLLNFAGQEFVDYMELEVTSTAGFAAPVAVAYNALSTAVYDGFIYAGVILLLVYALIIFDLVHRTVAAMAGSLAAISVLAAINDKPALTKVLEWLDYETLCLLFGMMVIVAIICESGIFDWSALKAYKLTGGKTWPLITILCVFAAVVSAFLDNVTTILLLTPVTIRLCEVLGLDPKHVLMMEVIFSNIGGTATAVGDPPNVLIVSNRDLMEASGNKINFSTFTLHMSVGSVFVMFAAYGFVRFLYRKKEFLKSKDPPGVSELKHEVDIWRRTSNSIYVATREESMVKALLFQKINTLEHMIQAKIHEQRADDMKDFNARMSELEKKYVIHDKILLIKSLVVLGAVMIAFFINPFVSFINIGLGWIAIFGAIWLLILADYSDIEGVLHRIEWATLLFFAALFVLMEALDELGLISWIGDQTSNLIKSVPETSRLAVAIIIILWISALVSSFIDNIPFTTAMIPIVVQLSNDKSLGLELSPLVWALAFGACLGGNGTLIGASANVVCAGIAETHGHGFTFFEFFKFGFPVMLVTVTIAMCYLLICHVALSWSL